MKTISGSCHCGAVRFEAGFDGNIETSRCNCSICAKSRFWKTLVPADSFTVLTGEDVLLSYRFGSRTIDHRICRTCGVKVFGTVTMADTDLVAISVPCLDLEPEGLAALPVAFENGRCDEPQSTPDITSYL